MRVQISSTGLPGFQPSDSVVVEPEPGRPGWSTVTLQQFGVSETRLIGWLSGPAGTSYRGYLPDSARPGRQATMVLSGDLVWAALELVRVATVRTMIRQGWGI